MIFLTLTLSQEGVYSMHELVKLFCILNVFNFKTLFHEGSIGVLISYFQWETSCRTLSSDCRVTWDKHTLFRINKTGRFRIVYGNDIQRRIPREPSDVSMDNRP